MDCVSIRWIVWSIEEHTSAGAAARWNRVPVAKAKGLLCAAVLLAAGIFHSLLHPPFHPFSLERYYLFGFAHSSAQSTLIKSWQLSVSLSLSFALTFPFLFLFNHYSVILQPEFLLGRTQLSLFLLKFSEHCAVWLEFRYVVFNICMTRTGRWIEYLEYICDDFDGDIQFSNNAFLFGH